MYEQFKELADVDITTGPMEVGPTTHYVMGGIRVDAETGATTVAGPVRGGRGRRRHARREPAGRQLAVGPARVRGADRRRGRRRHAAEQAASRTSTRSRSGPPTRELGGAARADRRRGPVRDPARPAGRRCSGWSASSGSRPTSTRRSVELADAARRAGATFAATGGRAYNPGWNLVFELDHLLTVSEAITRSARQRTESRGAHSRLDYPDTDDGALGPASTASSPAAPTASMTVDTTPLPEMPAELRALLGSSDH